MEIQRIIYALSQGCNFFPKNIFAIILTTR